MGEFWETARRHRWAIAAMLALGMLGAALLGQLQRPQYSATTELLFSADAGSSATDLNQASTYLERQMTSYARLVQSPVVLDPTIKTLRLDTTAADLSASVDTQVPTSTTLLDITVVGDDPQEVVKIANGVGDSTVAAIKNISPAPQGQSGAVKASVITRAVEGGESGALSLPLLLILGAALGAVVAVGLIAVLSTDKRIRSVGQLRDLSGTAPVITGSLSTETTGEPKASHRVRSSLQSLWPALGETGEGFVLSFTSPTSVGHALLARGVAESFADNGRRVLLVDSDTTQGDGPEEGLAEVANGLRSWRSVVQEGDRPGLRKMSVGQLSGTASVGLLGRPKMREWVREASAENDVVVLVAPPVGDLPDAEELARLADGTALVIDSNRIERSTVSAALERLQAAHPGAVAVIANGAHATDA